MTVTMAIIMAMTMATIMAMTMSSMAMAIIVTMTVTTACWAWHLILIVAPWRLQEKILAHGLWIEAHRNRCNWRP